MTQVTSSGQAAGSHWDPHQYLRFSDHRLRPALELLDRVNHQAPQVVYDLGCGTGQITSLMAGRWPGAKVYGLDNSREMLDAAGKLPGSVQWIEADIATWEPAERPDIIYSNATLQWVEGHEVLFPRLAGFLKPGGVLAVQMPLSWGMPSHRLMRETLADGGPKGTPLGPESLRREMARDWVPQGPVYYDWLVGKTTGLDIWSTEYLQVLQGPDPVLEWVKGTGLRPALLGLQEAERATFLAEYTKRLRAAYPLRPDGCTVYPFLRLFMVATV